MDDFTGIAHPLNKPLKKGTTDTFQVDNKPRHAFKALINEDFSPPVLSFSKDSLLYSLDCDTRDYGDGFAVFRTHPDGQQNLIKFFVTICSAGRRQLHPIGARIPRNHLGLEET